jgi:hypothetical protein
MHDNATITAATIRAAATRRGVDKRRVTVEKQMDLSGKSLLPRLGVSANMSPNPAFAEPWVSD